ncbi:hypothetical protein GH810_14495 [Acetobacterium paludosum]|uniref:Uncharacterized protein n=1 Tax=Acetobacterium paludosum TaxID=52693 RepID=A0A923KXF3_9FIRM|nr:hypothetical protein [Acetobacterium paludosum]MBC3889520.1 hypothetical protein [Acetobacterium paludosum]
MELAEVFAYIVGGAGILFGFLSWRRSDNKDAERLGVIETKLENILNDLKSLIFKIDKSDDKFSAIDRDIAKLKEQVKTCFSLLEKEKNK